MVQCETRFKLPAVFIVSSGRSGTTLLASILNASEQIYIPYESDFMARAYPHYQAKTIFTEDDYRDLFRIFKLAAKEDGWELSEDQVVSHLKKRSPQSFADVNAVIYEIFHQQEKTTDLMWGIKAPVLIASLDRIHEVCPNAKIVHIIRDGRDVYLSYKKVHETSDIKFGPKGVIENALYWIDGLRRVEDFVKLNSNEQLYELRYDELLSDSEATLAKLCQFIGIEYRSTMHEDFNALERNKKVAPKHFQKSIHKKLHGGLDPKNTKKYLTAMSRLEQIKFELVAIPYLVKYGYEPVFPILNMPLFSCLRIFLYFFARQFNNLRYDKRDRKIYEQAKQVNSST